MLKLVLLIRSLPITIFNTRLFLVLLITGRTDNLLLAIALIEVIIVAALVDIYDDLLV
jgi:hypothetical protein